MVITEFSIVNRIVIRISHVTFNSTANANVNVMIVAMLAAGSYNRRVVLSLILILLMVMEICWWESMVATWAVQGTV